jgi:hypothetical protein
MTKAVFLALAAIAWTTGVQVAAEGVRGVRGQEDSGEQLAKSRVLKGSVKGMRKSHSKNVGGSGKMMIRRQR